MSPNARLAVVATTVVVIVGGFVIASSGGGSSRYSGAATVTVLNAKARDGIVPLRYKKGQTVDLTIKSDTADEIHIHGYDLHKDIKRQGTVHFAFLANIDGVFIIELETHRQQIASLMVTP